MSGNSRLRRGIASVIGAVFLILIFFSAMYTLYVSMDLYDTFISAKEQELLTACRVFEASNSIQAVWLDASKPTGWPATCRYYNLTAVNYFHEVIGISSFTVRTADSYYYATQGTSTLGDKNNKIDVNLVEAKKYDVYGNEVWQSDTSADFATRFPIWLSPGEKLEIIIAVDKTVTVTSIMSSFVEGSGGVGAINYVR